jgi:hypothetical protein
MAGARQLSITFAALKLRQTRLTELCAGDGSLRCKPPRFLQSVAEFPPCLTFGAHRPRFPKLLVGIIYS